MLVKYSAVLTHKTRVFALIVLGQAISNFGTRVAGFGMGVWIYQETGSKLQFGIAMLLRVLPTLFILPVAGVIADRWDRRWVMILSDSGAASAATLVMVFALLGQLQVWHIYLAILLNAIFDSIHWPAFSASIPMLIPKEHLGRANGIMNTTDSLGQLIGPMLAGLLMVTYGLGSLVLIDLVTFLIAVLMLLPVQIPQPATADTGKRRRKSSLRSLVQEALYGLTYVRAHTGLLALFVFQNVQFLLAQMGRVLLTPLILDLSTADVLGLVTTVSAVGGIAGGLITSMWGGPKRRIRGVLDGAFLIGVAIIVAGLFPSVVVIAACMTFTLFISPVQASTRQALWQSKVPPNAQGRIGALNQLGRTLVMTIAFSTAGLLVDTVFEPLTAPEGPLAGNIGQILGTGPGRSVGLFYICLGILLVLATAVAYLYPRLRLVEDEVTDAI